MLPVCVQAPISMRTCARWSKGGGQLVHGTPQKCPVGVYVAFTDPSGVEHELLQFEKA